MLKTTNAMLVYALLGMLLLMSTMALATTAAGTRIQNQASATYRFEGDNTVRTVTSNLVTTLVQKVAGVTLSQDSTKSAASEFEVFFPHVITNTGNDVNEFTLSLDHVSGNDFKLTDLALYADANHDGQPDNLNLPITEAVPLAQGESFYFIASGRLPNKDSGKRAKITVKATSKWVSKPGDVPVSAENTDTVTVTDRAVVQVTKAMSHSNGATPSGGYTVTLTYKNRSSVKATNITIIDKLPAGMSYLAGSATWSVNSLSLTDDADGKQGSGADLIAVCAYHDSCTGTDQDKGQFTAVIDQLTAGNSASISFKVSIDGNLPASTLKNTAQFKYDNGSGSVTALEDTNTVPFEVLQNYGVVINGSSTNNADGADEPVTIGSVTQGGSIKFENIVWNTGNGDDTFDLTIDYDETKTTFPAGTFFQFLKSDGESPLMDTNGNGIADTGVLAEGTSKKIYIRATLPNNTSGNNGGAGYKLEIVATSKIGDVDNITNQLTNIQASAVDLTNNQAVNATEPEPEPVLGQGSGPEENPVTVLPVIPGEKGVFLLYVNNISNRTDNYLLSYSATEVFDPIAALPVGWRVDFYFDGGNNDCNVLGDLTNTAGLLNAGENRLICAVVSVPKTATVSSTPQSIYFRALSATTGAADVKHDAVSIEALYSIIVSPNQQGQADVNSSIVYSHTITNNSNTVVSNSNIVYTNTEKNWNIVIYVDANGDNRLDADDQLFENQTLAIGESLTIFVKVFVPEATTQGTENITLLKLTGLSNEGDVIESRPVTDVTQVSSSSVRILREQALDADCNGIPDGPNNCTGDACFTAASFSVAQTQCIIYQLTATNFSRKAVNNVQVNDVVPNFTSFYTASGYPTTTHGNVSDAQDGNVIAGTTGGASVTLESGEEMILKFAVRLD